MRFIMDWSDPDAFSLELAFGQSGNPFSAHFDDFFADFLAGRRWTLPWSRDEVEARTPRQLELRPARPRE
jgi:acyl-homoserine lactone acylase PvdQ